MGSTRVSRTSFLDLLCSADGTKFHQFDCGRLLLVDSSRVFTISLFSHYSFPSSLVVCIFMSSSHLKTRSIAITDAWLEDIQLTISQAHRHPTSKNKKRSHSHTPCQLSSRKRIALAIAEENTMTSPKSYADHDAEDSHPFGRHPSRGTGGILHHQSNQS